MSDGRTFWYCPSCKTMRRGAVCKICRVSREEAADRRAKEQAARLREGK